MADDNPSPPAPTYRLFTPKAVLVASLFGSFAAGGLIMALNYRRLGQSRAAWSSLAFGLLGTAAEIFVRLLVRLHPVAWLLVQTGGMFTIAHLTQGPLLDQHVSRRGLLASSWVAFGIGVLSLGTIGGALVLTGGLSTMLDQHAKYGTRVTISDKLEVYYSGEATRADAEALAGRFAEEVPLDGKRTIAISKSFGQVSIYFPVVAGTWSNSGLLAAVGAWGESLPARFERPFMIHLCDDRLEPRETVTIYRRP